MSVILSHDTETGRLVPDSWVRGAVNVRLTHILGKRVGRVTLVESTKKGAKERNPMSRPPESINAAAAPLLLARLRRRRTAS